jgi:hypothetical protein
MYYSEELPMPDTADLLWGFTVEEYLRFTGEVIFEVRNYWRTASTIC